MFGPLQPVGILAQLPLAQAGQLLLVIGVSFLILTVISSTVRFHRMIQLDESALPTADRCNDFFFIQVTRYLSKINRASSGFCVLVFQFRTMETELRPVQEHCLELLRNAIRESTDKACLFRDDCVAALLDTEEQYAPDVARRVLDSFRTALKTLPEITALRAGASVFPTHGLRSQALIDAAVQAMETAAFETALPLVIAPRPEGPEEINAEELSGEIGKQEKNAALDPLTGVIKPAVIGSYLRKYLAELRHKKHPAALLCVGINRSEQILKLHGEAATDEVIAGVSKVLQRLTRDNDLIGRFHRDGFLVLAPCTLSQGEAIALRLRDAVQKEIFLVNGRPIKTSISIGIAAYPEHGRALRDLFGGAHLALDTIRKWETSACLVYDPAQHGKIKHHETRS